MGYLVLFLFRSAQNYMGEAGLFLNLEGQTDMKGYFLTWVLLSSGQNTLRAWLLWNFLLILLVLRGLTDGSFWKEHKKSVTFLTNNLTFIWLSWLKKSLPYIYHHEGLAFVQDCIKDDFFQSGCRQQSFSSKIIAKIIICALSALSFNYPAWRNQIQS